MKQEDKDQLQIQQIAKYLANEMDENGKADFEIDVALDPGKAALFDEMKRKWKMLDSYKNSKKVDADRAWKALNERFESENLIPSDKLKVGRKPSAIKRLSLAAAFVGLVALATALIWNTKLNQSPQMVSVQNESSGTTLVQSLTDGSLVYLNQQASLSYPQVFGSKERKVMLNGEAFFDIVRNPQKPFVIETDGVIVEVLGTAFNIKTLGKSSFELVVERGKVRVSLKDNPSVSQIVVAGERMDLTRDQLVKSKWVDDGSLAWRMGRMQFKDETLLNIVRVINTNYHSNLTIPDAATASRKLTVTFENNSLNDIIELVCISMNLQTNQVGDSTVLSEINAR